MHTQLTEGPTVKDLSLLGEPEVVAIALIVLTPFAVLIGETLGRALT